MARTWVLHTETKGTGAQMVPLERVKQRPSVSGPVFVTRAALREAELAEPKPRAPRRFKVVDLMTRQALVDGADAPAAIDVLKQVRSIVDVNVYVRHEEHDRWRLLTLAEKRAIWDLSRSSHGLSG